MGRKSRDKGASGERELARELSRLFGVEARRGCQYHGGPGSPDVAADIPDVHIECKRSERLRLYEALQQAVDQVEPEVSEVVLAYGLCSNGVVGVIAPPQGLYIPRVHDCIALFLGSQAAYREAFQRRAGSYYLTPGWVAEQRDPLGMLEDDTWLRKAPIIPPPRIRSNRLQPFFHLNSVIHGNSKTTCGPPSLRQTEV